MKRVIKFVLLPLVLLVLVVVVAFHGLAQPVAYDREAYVDLPITLSDGEQVPLGGLVERREERAAEREAAREPEADEEAGAAREVDRGEIRTVIRSGADAGSILETLRRAGVPMSPSSEIVWLARDAYQNGRLDEAVALLNEIPPGDEQYSRAQRYLGWEVLTERGGRPRAGLAHMHKALQADPLDGENWQDASRVFLASIGVPFDPVHGTWEER